MKLTDTIKLATMGYKPADIKRLSESDIPDDQIIKLAESGYSVKDVDELISLTQEQNRVVQPEPTAPTEPEPASAPDPKGEPAAIDYKELFEKQSKELEETKQKLSGLQQDLTHRNLGGAPQERPESQFKKSLMAIY